MQTQPPPQGPGFGGMHSPLTPEGAHSARCGQGPGVARKPEGGVALSPACPSSLKSPGVTLRPEMEGTATASKTMSPHSQPQTMRLLDAHI